MKERGKIEHLYNIYLKIISFNIETINYKSKNPQVNLMGSNPTPRAYLWGSSNIIRFDTRYLSLDKQQKRRKKETMNEILTLNIQKTRELITHSDEETEIEKKLESVTKSLRKQYFKNNLVTLSKKNIENARTICNYIVA